MNIPKSLFSDRNILVFYILLMNIHLVYFEGAPFSWLKNAIMVLSIPIFFARGAYFSKAVIIATAYWLTMFLSSLFHPETFRFSTLGYSGMFLMTFMMFYNLLYKEGLELRFFNRLIRTLIIVFVSCHLLQQAFMLIGVHFMPLINLSNQFYLALGRLPSLTLEPSVFARVMGVLIYAYLKGHEYEQGQPLSFKQLISREHRWIFIGFLWSIFTMGSGTAFIVLGVLGLYFLKKQYLYVVVPLLVVGWLTAPYLHIKQLDRAIAVVVATSTFDAEVVNNVDGSAAARVNPAINTINELDLTKADTWFGKGIDATPEIYMQKTGKIGNIDKYGFLCYLVGLLLVFTCCIRFFSIGTILYFSGIAGSTGNIAYGWGTLMIFICITYFSKQQEHAQ